MSILFFRQIYPLLCIVSTAKGVFSLKDLSIDHNAKIIKAMSPEEIGAIVLPPARTGYICPNPQCRDGSGKDGTGASSSFIADGVHSLYCGKCGCAYDNISIFGFYFSLDPKFDFVEIVKRVSEMYNLPAIADDITKKPRKSQSKPVVPNAYKNLIDDANGKLPEFVFALKDQTWRGLTFKTLDHFHCGYLPNWHARKNAADTPRVIIPTSYNHYLARYTGTKEQLQKLTADCGVKEHRGSKEIFNYKHALLESTNPFVLLVEGEIDAMSIWQVTGGQVNVIAISGCVLSPAMADKIKALPQKKNFAVMLDNDDAGHDNAPLLVAKLKSLGHNAVAVFLTNDTNEDANQILQAEPEYLLDRVNNAIATAESLFKNSPVNEPAPVVDTPAPDYNLLFDGFKPIRVSAGAILNVAPPHIKKPLESLFFEKNFLAFVLQVADQIGSENSDVDLNCGNNNSPDNNPQHIVESEHIKQAVTWLVKSLTPYFKTFATLKTFITNALTAAHYPNVANSLQENTDLANVFNSSTAPKFDFNAKFRKKLISFAQSSPKIFDSLLRFDYQQVKDFLQETFTDLICAEQLVRLQKNFLLFATDQITWYIWADNHWQPIVAKSLSEVYRFWTPVARKASLLAEFNLFKIDCELLDFQIRYPDYKKDQSVNKEKFARIKAAKKFAASKLAEANELESNRAINNLLSQASGLPQIHTETKRFDKNLFLLNCANCTINLETMETYTARRDDFITLDTGTTYDPNATCDAWENFINAAIPDTDVRDWLQRFFGYSLSGSTDEDIFVFVHGVGGSGKTTFLNTIKTALGDYAATFDVATITANSKPKDGDEPSPSLARLRGRRLACSSETERGRRLDEAKIKHLTGGEAVVARELHKPPFEFMPQFKMVIDGNYLLNISDVNDRGLQRRIRIVPFNNPPSPDKIDTALEQKLTTPEARSSVLNWLLVGWRNYQQRGLQDTPNAMTAAVKNFYEANDAISDFLETQNYSPDSKHKIPVAAVWRTYNEWRKNSPQSPTYKRAEFKEAILHATAEDNITVRKISKQEWFAGFIIDTEVKQSYGMSPP